MLAARRPDWSGRTVVCLASGPSLTREDVETVREAGLTTIVTNTTFLIAPWADVLFGFDDRWWLRHVFEVREVFKGQLVSALAIADELHVESTHRSKWFKRFGNSGACAISFAVSAGASRVVLLGFDSCDGPNGEKHWHGDHPPGMSNCLSMKNWPEQFKKVAQYARENSVEIVNCSRRTVLECFERMPLDQVVRVPAQA